MNELTPLILKHLTFTEFQKINLRRCQERYHEVPSEKWPVQNWALAIAGETGELCNLIKKCIRGDFSIETKRQEILDEIADIITYCDLLVSHLGEDTAQVVWDKFERVSERIGWEGKEVIK